MAFQPLHPDDLALRDALQALPPAPVPTDFDIDVFTTDVVAAIDAYESSRPRPAMAAGTAQRRRSRLSVSVRSVLRAR